MKKLRNTTFLLILITLTSFSCNPENLEEVQAQLDENRGKWESHNITSYRYTYRLSCGECTSPTIEPVSIRVENLSITSVEYLNLSDTIIPGQYGNYKTIEDIFDEIQNAIDINAYSITVTYDDTYGYPASGSIDERLMVADEEYGWQVSGLEIFLLM